MNIIWHCSSRHLYAAILGTDVAEEMLAKAPDTNIIFLTTSDEYAVKAFALSATHYLFFHLSGGEILKQRGKQAQMYKELQKYPEFI